MIINKKRLIIISSSVLVVIVGIVIVNFGINTKPKIGPAAKHIQISTLPEWEIEVAQPEEPEYTKIKSTFDFESYTSINPDVVGYINIYGTGLEEVITQSSNGERDYYLYRDWKGNYNVHGTVYFDNNFSFTDPTAKAWLLYGHNNANGSGFPQIHKYDPNRQGSASTLAYYKDHHLAQLDTVDEAGTWQIFAVLAFSNNPDDGEHFNFLDNSFANTNEYQEYIDNIRIRSLINTPVKVTTDDTIAVLCTCITDGYNVYGNYTDWRLLMAMRRVPYGEEAEFDASLVEVNPNPLMPDIWHNDKGIAKPTTIPEVKSINY